MTNSSNLQFHDTNAKEDGLLLTDDQQEQQIKDKLLQVNNHQFRQSTFFGSCIRDLRQKNKTWMLHINSDEYLVLHPEVKTQNHWRNLTLTPEIRLNSILKF
jgi:hypothetical protein